MSRNIKRWTECEIHLSADELADVFWHMDAEEQAHFFERLNEVSDGNLAIQMQYVTDHPRLNDGGRQAMRVIGDYADKEPTHDNQ